MSDQIFVCLYPFKNVQRLMRVTFSNPSLVSIGGLRTRPMGCTILQCTTNIGSDGMLYLSIHAQCAGNRQKIYCRTSSISCCSTKGCLQFLGLSIEEQVLKSDRAALAPCQTLSVPERCEDQVKSGAWARTARGGLFSEAFIVMPHRCRHGSKETIS